MASPARSAAAHSSVRMLPHLVLQLRSTSSQIFVPTSTMDWCISRFIWSPSDERGRREQLRDVRAQFPGIRVDDLELLLDTDGEPVSHSRSNDTVEPLLHV